METPSGHADGRELRVKRCLEPGCMALVAGTRCALHGGDIHNSKEWKRRSREARARQPWCSRCGRRDDLTTHHVKQDGRVTGAVDVLCRACNAELG